jgi:hypothetical protein
MQPPMPTLSDLIDVLVATRMPTVLLALLMALSSSVSRIQLVQGDTVNAWIVLIYSLSLPRAVE